MTQTCFQGRFGEEIGNDQFGASIMVHGPEPTPLDSKKEQIVKGRNT